MKNLILTFVSLIVSQMAFGSTTTENTGRRSFGYQDALIFVESGITFSVYPDGEYDFFIDNPNYVGVDYRTRNVSISFNSGFNYNPWVQYDDYGAVIQIENTPIYYDFYGRVSRIGGLNIFYQRGRVSRIGGLYVYYDGYGRFARFNGYINMYNRLYVHRPVYSFFTRPAVSFCLVNTRPYRRYYHPVRYTYYRPYRNNHRRAYAPVGRTYHYKESNPRRNVYRNDRRVASRNDASIQKAIRKRSLKYETNKRAYSKSDAYRTRTQRSAVGSNNRKSVTPRRSQNAGTPNRGYSRTSGKNSGVTAKRSMETRNTPTRNNTKSYKGKSRSSKSNTPTVNRSNRNVSKNAKSTRSISRNSKSTGVSTKSRGNQVKKASGRTSGRSSRGGRS